jgi:DedD protein
MTFLSTSQIDAPEDTEITLGTGKMLALFFGLVVLCAVFFGMGFSMGKNSVRTAPELLPSPNTSSGTRPSATNRPGTPAASDSKPSDQTAASSGDAAASSNQAAQPGDQQAAPQAVPAGSGYFVQVAAVSKQEDADALVEALKARQYPAFILNPSPDKLFHVQIGPFADPKDAESMRAKLMNDGYNPILKK